MDDFWENVGRFVSSVLEGIVGLAIIGGIGLGVLWIILKIVGIEFSVITDALK